MKTMRVVLLLLLSIGGSLLAQGVIPAPGGSGGGGGSCNPSGSAGEIIFYDGMGCDTDAALTYSGEFLKAPKFNLYTTDPDGWAFGVHSNNVYYSTWGQDVNVTAVITEDPMPPNRGMYPNSMFWELSGAYSYSVGSFYSPTVDIYDATVGTIRVFDNTLNVNSGAVTVAESINGTVQTYGGTTQKAAGVWSWLGLYGGAVTNAYNYYAEAPSTGGTVTNYFGLWSDDMSATTATNTYYEWFDSRGVYRVREDSTFDSVGQAIPALYNPLFTKYTPGAANYERIVQQWHTNRAEIGAEKGGTGTLRGVDFLGADYRFPSVTTGAASGKHVLCIDTTTKQLYESSTGTDCSN